MRDHLKPWRSATTLADLGELTALWLEGAIDSQPGYKAGAGHEKETLPYVGVLAAVNRAGYVTTASQPGDESIGVDGALWRQRAAVTGFAAGPMCEQLLTAAASAGLAVVVHETASRWWITYDQGITVTDRDGWPMTGFGACLSRRHIRDGYVGYGVCTQAAQRALCDACQVAIVDPDWNRNDRLWPMLAEVAAG